MSLSSYLPERIPRAYLVTTLATYLLWSFLVREPQPPRPPRRLTRDPEKVASPVPPEYDVVIIGGGTAGCILAARLSEDPSIRVLLLEVGDSSREELQCKIPMTYGTLVQSERDHIISTEPQVHANNLKIYWPRGKMLGGCSAMNAMMFHIGAPSDFDEWAKTGLENAEQWCHKELLPYFLKAEDFVPHKSFPDVDVSMRGSQGPMTTGFFGNFHNISAKWIEACKNMGIPFNPDFNNPLRGTLGVSKTHDLVTFIGRKGRRVSTETAYLTEEVLQRPNLEVMAYARVSRILFDAGDKPRATGVEFTSEAVPNNSLTYWVRVKREVIVSGGAVHSPQILMLSGIGPKEHLAKHDIPLVLDLPGVGQNLMDHVQVQTMFRAKDSLLWVRGLYSNNLSTHWKMFKSLVQWTFHGTGPLTSNLAECAAFTRSDDLSVLGSKDDYDIKDETSGPNAPDLESIILPIAYPTFRRKVPEGHAILLVTGLLRPQSKGTIQLHSSRPTDPPIVDPQYLSSKNDIAILVRGLRLAFRMIETDPFKSALIHDDDPAFDHNLHLLSDSELEGVVRQRVDTLYHPTSTCRMARLEDGGVVDAYLRVHGVKNLRVVDASVFPCVPAAHTATPVIGLAEKASDIIKLSMA